MFCRQRRCHPNGGLGAPSRVFDGRGAHDPTLQPMRHGARNQIEGKITSIKKGGVMCQVEVAIPGGFSMTSVMTLDSLKDLGLKKGSQVKVLVKAVNVLLATGD